LKRAGFPGPLVPVNPSGGEILGLEVCPSASQLRGEPDLAMVIIPRSAVAETVDQLADAGVRGIILSTAGYADIGAQGRAAQETLAARVRERGLRLMGPNSIGTINPRAGVATSIVTLDPMESGGVSLVGQTGVFSAGWARWIGDRRPFGLCKVACVGNMADVDSTDLLAYLAADEQTTTIGMYIEGISDGPRFIQVAGHAAAHKPVVVLKGGRSEAGAAATASHTGSLATSDAVFDAVCRRTGLVRAVDAEHMFDALAAFEALPLPRGNRVGVLSITGQGCVATSDAAEELGLEIPPLSPETRQRLLGVVPPWAPLRNPVDTWSAVEQHGASKTMSHICGALLDQHDIDAVVAIFVLMPESSFDVEAVFGPVLREHRDKPVLAVYLGGSDDEIRRLEQGFRCLSVPSYPTPERALRALAAMVEYAGR
jgi:acetyltransferase